MLRGQKARAEVRLFETHVVEIRHNKVRTFEPRGEESAPLRSGRISGCSLLHLFQATRSFATMVMAQDFYAAFGHDGLGQIGSETTLKCGHTDETVTLA